MISYKPLLGFSKTSITNKKIILSDPFDEIIHRLISDNNHIIKYIKHNNIISVLFIINNTNYIISGYTSVTRFGLFGGVPVWYKENVPINLSLIITSHSFVLYGTNEKGKRIRLSQVIIK